MRQLRIAAALIAIYAAAVIVYALTFASFAQDASGLPRAGIRFAGSLAVAYGLWRGARWAWWLGVVLSGVLFAAGATTLSLAARGGLFEGRPYPALDYAFFAATTAALGAALVLLLLRPARDAAKAPRPPA